MTHFLSTLEIGMSRRSRLLPANDDGGSPSVGFFYLYMFRDDKSTMCGFIYVVILRHVEM